MKVAYVSHCNFPNRFAHSIQIMKNAQAWNVVADDFTLYINIDPIKYFQFNQQKLDSFYGIKHSFSINKTPLFFDIEHWLLTKYTSGFSRILKNYYFKKAAKRLKKDNVDVAYTRTVNFPKLAINKGIPVILESHNPLNSEHDNQEILNVINDDLFLSIVTISHELKSRMVSNGIPPEKILVAPDGVDLDIYQDNLTKEEARELLGYPKQGKYALYVGHLYKDRGIKEILFSAEQSPDINFVIVGGHQSDIGYWQNEVNERSLSNVELVGFVENQHISLYQWMADVLLMPYSKSCGTSEWMSPLKLFEYMASGRAIIASHFPVFDEILTDKKNCLLVEADNGHSLLEGISIAFEDSELMSNIGNQAFEDVKQYSWTARVKYIIEELKIAAK